MGIKRNFSLSKANKRFFQPKSSLFQFSSNCVTLGIKSFGVRQGFLIFKSNGDKNEFQVFPKQKIIFFLSKLRQKAAFFVSVHTVSHEVSKASA
jgi:hypothetical protein